MLNQPPGAALLKEIANCSIIGIFGFQVDYMKLSMHLSKFILAIIDSEFVLITGIVLTGHDIRDLGVLQGLSIIILHNIHLCDIILSFYFL